MKKITKKQELKKIKRKNKIEFNKKWKAIRELVKFGQDNKCYICDKEVFGKSAHIHHIIDRRILELFFNLNNLVLLCPRCHKLDPYSVHNSSLYFVEILKNKEPKRYEYLTDFIKMHVHNISTSI